MVKRKYKTFSIIGLYGNEYCLNDLYDQYVVYMYVINLFGYKTQWEEEEKKNTPKTQSNDRAM